MEYTLIRSSRKTFGISVTEDGVVVRAPAWARPRDVDSFLMSKYDWIIRAREHIEERKRTVEGITPMTPEELAELIARAKPVFSRRAAHFAPIVGVDYRSVTVRAQRTRWGSCSAKGALSFNCLLMLAPPEVLDSVVLHELCHRKALDHSEKFYREFTRVCPDYKAHRQWLKENGLDLIARLPRNG